MSFRLKKGTRVKVIRVDWADEGVKLGDIGVTVDDGSLVPSVQIDRTGDTHVLSCEQLEVLESVVTQEPFACTGGVPIPPEPYNKSSVNFKPIGDRVLIKVLQETISGAIYIPDTDDSLPQRKGEVVALPDDEVITSGLKVGDRLLFQNLGVDVTLDGVDYKLVHKEYLQGVLL